MQRSCPKIGLATSPLSQLLALGKIFILLTLANLSETRPSGSDEMYVGPFGPISANINFSDSIQIESQCQPS
jgi:hypothetical protein